MSFSSFGTYLRAEPDEPGSKQVVDAKPRRIVVFVLPRMNELSPAWHNPLLSRQQPTHEEKQWQIRRRSD
jgi:hypothetical protein